jgi:Domain of unknown function (DUF4179)
MLADKQPRDPYADLLDGYSDPALVHDLDRLHHPTSPPHLRPAIARAIEQRAAALRTPALAARHWPRFALPRRAAVALVALLAFTMLAAAAAPLVTSIVDKAFGMDPGTNRIVTEHLGQELGLSQTVNGFTVTIERVYADANQIVIGYSVSGPSDRSFNNFLAFGPQRGQTPVLVDDTGREFQHSPIGWGAGVEAGKGGYLLLYDATPIAGNPANLTLHLAIGSLDVIERVNAGTPTVAGSALRPTPQKGADPGPYCEPEVCIYSVDGPFAFDLTIPFAASRVAEPHQTVEVGGVPLTLDRISSTPTGTLVTLRGAGPGATVTLTGGNTKYTLGQPGPIPAQLTSDQLFNYTTTDPLPDGQTDWTLTVTTTRGTATFHVTLP